MLKSNFEGETRIYKKEENGITKYYTQLSQKNINGEWENTYIDLQFPKDTILENKEDIFIKKSFLCWYKTKNGYIHYKLKVLEYEKTSKEEYVPNDETTLPF